MNDQPHTVILTGKWLTSLLNQVNDCDFCFICDNHPSHGHAPDCPLLFGEKKESTDE